MSGDPGLHAQLGFWLEFFVIWMFLVVFFYCASSFSTHTTHYAFNAQHNQKLIFHSYDASFKVLLCLLWILILKDFRVPLFPVITEDKTFLVRVFLVVRVATLYFHVEWLVDFGLNRAQITHVLAEDGLLLIHSIIFIKINDSFTNSNFIFMSTLHSMVLALSQMMSFLAIGGNMTYVTSWMVLLRWMPLGFAVDLVLEMTSVSWATTSTAAIEGGSFDLTGYCHRSRQRWTGIERARIMTWALSGVVVINCVIDVVTGRKCLLRGTTANIHPLSI